MYLYLYDNQLSGPIPAGLGSLSELFYLYLENNQLSGVIPPQLGNLNNLNYLRLDHNQLSGSIPLEIGNMIGLRRLNLSLNQLTGSIPTELSHLSNLYYLYLENNRLSGSIPPELGQIKLRELKLKANQLTGGIPEGLFESWNWNVKILDISSNKLKGRIPYELTNLNCLIPSTPTENATDFSYNALFADDPDLVEFLNEKDPDWAETQTLAPKNLKAAATGSTSVMVSWNPILYTGDTGGYRVYYSANRKGPYTFFGQTRTKHDTSLEVTGLNPATLYYFGIVSRTNPHLENPNIVQSIPSSIVTATTRGAIYITAPAGGETFYKTSSLPIEWSTIGVTGDVKILLIRSDKSGGYIVASGIPYNNSPYEYTIPFEVTTGSYIVKVKNGRDTPGISENFTIKEPSIIVTTPTGGEVFATGDTIPISWTTAGITGNLKIGLVRSDKSNWYLVTSTTPYNGSPLNYLIPSGVTPGTYFILIKKVGVTKGISGNITIN